MFYDRHECKRTARRSDFSSTPKEEDPSRLSRRIERIDVL